MSGQIKVSFVSPVAPKVDRFIFIIRLPDFLTIEVPSSISTQTTKHEFFLMPVYTFRVPSTKVSARFSRAQQYTKSLRPWAECKTWLQGWSRLNDAVSIVPSQELIISTVLNPYWVQHFYIINVSRHKQIGESCTGSVSRTFPLDLNLWTIKSC